MRIAFLMGIALPVNPQCLFTIGHHRGVGIGFYRARADGIEYDTVPRLTSYANASAVIHMQAELALG